jgi:hypothetical protein
LRQRVVAAIEEAEECVGFESPFSLSLEALCFFSRLSLFFFTALCLFSCLPLLLKLTS